MRYLLIMTTLFLLISCTQTTQEATYVEGKAFGTTYHIQYYSQENFEAQKGIDSVVEAVNQSVSTYIPNSDISKINEGDSNIIIDKIFRDVFVLSEKIHKQTNGYFDPTIGVLRNAYGFGEAKPLQKIDSTTLDSLMEYVGFDKVILTSENTIQKKHPQVYFDFNAIAKGYGIDLIGNYLEQNGITDYLIELGGEILTKGTNLSKQKPWTVGVESVNSDIDDRSYAETVSLTNRAMASSGNYRKFRVDSLTGKKYVHTINPLTGKAEQSDVTSATVIANTCAEADAYATSFMALGLDKSKKILKELSNVEAYLTYTDSLNQQKEFLTRGMQSKTSEN
ncbi:FAD:protein FMN transferase [uncultured Marixanthomonas sp.]|mgnify:CR=1 FL=1|uniref:FAD:protein FMN transferase n=1 Tax=uncultured Marixanthomonas sp. TaxID=757245 RepID=UPI0030DB5762|tara:strand:+ start:76542 stop:77552 length:1011 start_codon:yes stop_codon:yes gene_type:complete